MKDYTARVETAQKQKTPEKPTAAKAPRLSPDNPVTKRIAYIIIAALTTMVATVAVRLFIGISTQELITSTWYQVVLGAIAVILLVGWYYKRDQVQAAATLSKWILPVAIIMLFVNSLWPGTTLKGMKKIYSHYRATHVQITVHRQPAKSWKTVFSKEFVGVGFTGGDEPKDNDGTVHIAEFGKKIKIGDKVIVETYGNNIEIWNQDTWQKYRQPIINQAGMSGFLVARAKKGEKFKVIIKRFQ